MLTDIVFIYHDIYHPGECQVKRHGSPAIGITTARLLSRTVEAFLFQVGAADPGVFAAALLVLAVTGVIASVLPAMRAARVDPVVALRAE